jgi:hypothetical protein
LGDRTQTDSHAQNERIYRYLAGSAVVLVTVATVVYRLIEDWSWVDSVSFSVVAATTVGFGDLSPTTDASRLFTVFYILAGISLITTYLNVRLKRKVVGRHSDS